MRNHEVAEALRALATAHDRMTRWLLIVAGVGAVLVALELFRLRDREETRDPAEGAVRGPGGDTGNR